MGYPVQFALRYLGSKKRASISVGTAFAVLGVALGVAALATIMSVTGGFHSEFRQKVLGVNAHVLVLKYSTNFREYRRVMEKVAKIEGVVGVAPFSINPMMLNHGDATATGVLVKGVDPHLSLGVPPPPEGDEWQGRYDNLGHVLDLPQYVVAGSLDQLRRKGAKPPEARISPESLPFESLPEEDDVDAGVDPDEEIDEALDEPADAGPPGAASSGNGTPRPRDTSGFLGGQPEAAKGAASATSKPSSSADSAAEQSAAESAPATDEEGRPALPDEDVLPPDVDPDPCRDPVQVKALPGVVVGVSLAKILGLEHEVRPDGKIEWALGDCITITSPTIGFSFVGGQIKPPVAKRFRVIAIFEAGFDQYDSKLVYTDLYEAQTFYDHGDTVTGVEMKVEDIDQAGAVADQIAGMLASGIYHTMDWEELNHGLFTALRIQQWLMSAVLALIIVVAAFTVVATLIMVVLDKQREISVLKAMGATDFAILRIFVYQGGIIGLAGTTLGLLLGLAVCKGLLVYGFPLDPGVYFISRLPVLVRPLEFVLTGVIAILICLFATIIPSVYAASLRPADGFRNI
jgi:lipoprotein-releasing system permease protein